MLVLGRSQVEALLDVDSLIDALALAMADLSAGRASVPDRVAALVPEHDGFLAAMPGFLPSAGVLMTKLVSLFPHNDAARLPTHQALIVAFDPDTGEPTALLDGTAITAARTGACSALSARLLAREDATVLAVLGTGVQARSHARAICRVRPIRQIRVAGRDPARAAALAAELSAVLEAEVQAVNTYAEALDGADIAAATTHTAEPVIRRAWLTPGVHITSVGYNPVEAASSTTPPWPTRWCASNRVRRCSPRFRPAATTCSCRSATASSPLITCTPNWASSSPAAGRGVPHRTRSPSTSRSAWPCRTPRPRRWSSPPPARRRSARRPRCGEATNLARCRHRPGRAGAGAFRPPLRLSSQLPLQGSALRASLFARRRTSGGRWWSTVRAARRMGGTDVVRR